MNSMESAIVDVVDDIKRGVLPGETYYVGPNGIDGSIKDFSPEFKRAAQRLRLAAPQGTRLVAWFFLSTDGSRLHGQVALEAERSAPQIVWTIGEDMPELDYQNSMTIRYASASDRLVASALPIEALRNVGTKHDDATADLIQTLGYVPVLPQGQDLMLSFRQLALEKADA